MSIGKIKKIVLQTLSFECERNNARGGLIDAYWGLKNW